MGDKSDLNFPPLQCRDKDLFGSTDNTRASLFIISLNHG